MHLFSNKKIAKNCKLQVAKQNNHIDSIGARAQSIVRVYGIDEQQQKSSFTQTESKGCSHSSARIDAATFRMVLLTVVAKFECIHNDHLKYDHCVQCFVLGAAFNDNYDDFVESASSSAQSFFWQYYTQFCNILSSLDV